VDGEAGQGGRVSCRVADPLVTIGLPVFNGEKHLREALESLLAQDYRNVELLISDNCSTDGTREICLQAARNDDRVRYLRLDEALPTLDNFNRLVPLGRGTYFMWAAHDDVRERGFISRLVGALEAEPGAVLAFSRFDNIDETGRTVRQYAEDWGKVFSESRFRQFWRLALADEGATQKANHIYGLMRRADLVAIGGMAHSKVEYSGEDIVTLLRLLSRGRFVVVDEVLFHYRVRGRATRMNEPLFRYLFKRVLGETPGHRGNLLTYVRRNHALHAGMRRTILRETPLARRQKMILWLATFVKEGVLPFRAVTVGAVKEIRGYGGGEI
jgi:glycosyltransferase involved in cell wall biosynthesis